MITAGGILVYKQHHGDTFVLLAHPGGPFWAKKDIWSIPKGEVEEGETELLAAKREFAEELGFLPPQNEFVFLGEARQKSGKVNHIWAVEGDPDILLFNCESMVIMEWPPRSGNEIEFPENDRIAWHTLGEAKAKLFEDQRVFIDRVAEYLGIEKPEDELDKPQQSFF